MNREDADANGAARQRAGQGRECNWPAAVNYTDMIAHSVAITSAASTALDSRLRLVAAAVAAPAAVLSLSDPNTHKPAAPRAKRKKARLPATPPVTREPVPEPYLALAPAPITTVPAKPDNGLILPSDYVRFVNPSDPRYASNLMSPPAVMPGGSAGDRTNNSGTPRPLPTPTPPSRGFVSSLLSPPFVIPGGRSSSPLPLPPRPQLPHTGSSRSLLLPNRDTPPIAGRRSPMPPSDPNRGEQGASTPRRRAHRSRVVNATISRRQTVSSREEHLTRRASMRRTNVWDDLDLGDAPEPPPPFPFPTTSNARLPPTFSPVDLSPQTPGVTSVLSPGEMSESGRPYSPPPPFDEAIQQQPPRRADSPASPSESATVDDEDDESMFETDEQREDRRMWNADILAGYSLEERVAREAQRREARSEVNANGSSSTLGETSGVPRSEVEDAVREAVGSRQTSKEAMEIAVRTAIEVLRGRSATKAEILTAARDALAHKGRPGRRLPAEAVLPTAPATFVERPAGRPNVLTRQEEPDVFYRLVYGQNESQETQRSNTRSSTSPEREPSHNGSEDLLGANSSSSRSRSESVTALSPPPAQPPLQPPPLQPSPRMSTVEDIASIYNLPRPSPRQNAQAEFSNQTSGYPHASSPGPRARSGSSVSSANPNNASNAPRRQDTQSPAIQASPKQSRAESPFRTVTPGLYRTESYNRTGSPAPLFARSGSPLNYVTGSQQQGSRATSPQVSMSSLQAQQQQQSARSEDLMQTKKEILAALEKESARLVPEPPRPVMINTRQHANTAVVSRSEEPGVMYRLVPNKENSGGWPSQRVERSSQEALGLQPSPSPSQSHFGAKVHGHTRASSTSQAQSATVGSSSQPRQHRTPKSVATDPTPVGRERGSSISDPPQWTPPLSGVSFERQASPAPLGKGAPPPLPPLPPRPPLEYISEYKPRSTSGPTPGPGTSSRRHDSFGSVAEAPPTTAPATSSETRPWSIESSNSKSPLPPSSTPLPTPPTTSSAPTPRRPALPSIPSSSSVRTVGAQTPSTPGRISHRPNTSLQIHSAATVGLGIGLQPSVGYGSMPVTSPADRERTSPTHPARMRSDPTSGLQPSVGYGSLPVTAPTSAGAAYSSLSSAPGSSVYPSGPHTGLSPLPSGSPKQSTESAGTRWLKRLGSVDKLSIRSPSTGSLTTGANAGKERQGSMESGRGTPLLSDRQTESPSYFHRRPSADKEAQGGRRPESTSPRLSISAQRDMSQTSESGHGSKSRKRSTGSYAETKDEVSTEGPSRAILTDSPTPVDTEPKKRPGQPDPIDEWEEFHNEPAILFLSSTSPARHSFGLPPGAAASAFSARHPAKKSATAESTKDAPEPPTRSSMDSFKMPSRASPQSKQLSQASTGKSEESTSAPVDEEPETTAPAETPNLIGLDTPELEREAAFVHSKSQAVDKGKEKEEDQVEEVEQTSAAPAERRYEEEHSDEDPFGEDYYDDDDEDRPKEPRTNGTMRSPVDEKAPSLQPLPFFSSYDPMVSLSREKITDEEAIKPAPRAEEKIAHGPIRLDEHGNIIPPAREAALRRRNLYTPAADQDMSDPSAPQRHMSISKGKRPAAGIPQLLSVPSAAQARLSLSTHLNPPSPSAVSPDIVSLAASTSALLNLLEAADTRPMAESSAQGAAKAAAREQFRFELAQQREIEAQIHESLELVGNRTRAFTRDSRHDDMDQGDELPGYERGSKYVELAEKRASQADEPQWLVAPAAEDAPEEEIIDFSSPRDGASPSEQEATTVVKGHVKSHSQQYVVPPPSRARVSHSRSQSQATTPSLPIVPPPRTPQSASTSDLLSTTSSMDIRRRAPGPPPTRPPPPPPPSKQSPNRPPPPPPPSRPPPTHRPAPPVPGRFNKNADKTKDEASPSSMHLDPMDAINRGRHGSNLASDSHESLSDAGGREITPLSAPSTVWKGPRFVSPLDPFPPERPGDSASEVPPVPPRKPAAGQNSAPPHHRTVYDLRGQAVGPSDRPDHPRSAAPNLSSPDSPEVPANGPTSAPATQRVSNPALWNHPPVHNAAPSAPPVPRRPPPPIPVRNSAEFLASGAAPTARAQVRPRNNNVWSYSSSTSSLLDLTPMEPAEPSEFSHMDASDSGASGPSGPYGHGRRGSRGQLVNLPRWTSNKGRGQAGSSSLANPATPTTNGNHPYHRSPESNASHGSEHHTSSSHHTSSEHHSSEQPTASSEEAATPRRPSNSMPVPRSPEITDLDVFASRIEGSSREYEGLNHLADFLGPAKAGASDKALSTLLPAEVEVESRRINAKGKVKLKLSVLGVRVANCPICLAQFRGGDAAVLLPRCGHVGHETCARRWFRESDSCPVCRTELEMDA